MQHSCSIQDIDETIRDVLQRNNIPMTTKEIMIELYGKVMPDNVRRRIDRILSDMRANGIVGRDDTTRPFRYYIITRNPIEMSACRICGNIKSTSELHDGVCQICDEIEKQVVPSRQVKVSDNRRVNAFFGNYEPITTIDVNEHTPAMRKHVAILQQLLHEPVRVTTAKGYLHGILLNITPDGFMELDTDFGPAIVNSTKVAAIELFQRSPATEKERRGLYSAHS